jgi:hypothetical protein
MKTTWSEIRQAVYRLMFLEDAEMPYYEKYLYDAANYALNEIAMNVQPIVACYEISQMPLANCVPEDERCFSHGNEDAVITIDAKASAYSFQCDGNGTCTIEYTDGTSETVTMEAERTLLPYKGFFASDDVRRLIFSGSYAYRVRSLAVYPYVYGGAEDDIPSFEKYRVYDMEALTHDETKGRMFLSFLEDVPVVRVADGTERGEDEAADYFSERGSLLYLNAQEEGTFRVFYKQYPTKITSATSDDFELEISPEAVPLVPLLMAWRMCKDDDERKAILYFNEYQNAKAGIRRPMTVGGSLHVWGGARL